jgi:hypothetical protein
VLSVLPQTCGVHQGAEAKTERVLLGGSNPPTIKMAYTNFRRGGGWQTYMHSAKAKSRRATKDEIAGAKLTQHCLTTVSLGHYMQVGVSCQECVHFSTCPKAGNQDYCLFRPGRFVSKHLFRNAHENHQ